jgi:hypothetical protein
MPWIPARPSEPAAFADKLITDPDSRGHTSQGEWEKWTIEKGKAESLRELFSSTSNFTHDDP